MQLTALLPLLAIVGTAFAAVPNERSPFTGSVLAMRGNGNSNPPASWCDPKRPAGPAQQKSLFEQFKIKMYDQKNVPDAFKAYVAADLIEHGPYDPQGRDAVSAKLAPIFANGKYDIIHWNFDNGYGTVFLKVYLPTGEEMALVDQFRMDGTCIVEHWDTTQIKPADATNPIAMF